MCLDRKTAWQYLRLHRKGLDIDVKFATKHIECTGAVQSGPTVSVSHWSHNAATRPQVRPAFLCGVCLLGK